MADGDRVREDDARRQSVPDSDIDLDAEGVREEDARRQSVPDSDIDLDAEGVREDDARRQSVRDDWDGVPTVTETYTPSGSVEFRGDLHSSDDKTRVMHPSEGVGYEFDKSNTDPEMLRGRIESLAPEIQEALKRGDDNVRVSITASASRAGPEAHNQELSEARGQDMAKSMRDLGVKSDIDVTALGEGPAAGGGAPDVDNPADRVATFEVQVTERVPPPSTTETPPPADAELPRFEVPKTKAEAVSESIDKQLEKIRPSTDLKKMVLNAVKLGWLTGASGYAGAAAKVAFPNAARGVAIGVLYGADGRMPKQLKDDFWHKGPGQKYPLDQNIAKAGQNAFRQGLFEGFKQGRELSPGQREALWRELAPVLGDRGDRSSWEEKDWDAAARAFRRLHPNDFGERKQQDWLDKVRDLVGK